MTRDRRIVAGLDLGSTKTCAVIAEVVGDLPRRPVAKVLGVGLAKNGGVRRGIVRDIDETTRSVAAALRDAERMAGVKVTAVTCGVAGEHVAARPSAGASRAIIEGRSSSHRPIHSTSACSSAMTAFAMRSPTKGSRSSAVVPATAARPARKPTLSQETGQRPADSDLRKG